MLSQMDFVFGKGTQLKALLCVGQMCKWDMMRGLVVKLDYLHLKYLNEYLI